MNTSLNEKSFLEYLFSTVLPGTSVRRYILVTNGKELRPVIR
jgi:hypothetical protein